MTDFDDEAGRLQQEMQQVRCQAGDEVERFVASARTITDWHFYMRRAPLLFLGAAAALGYWKDQIRKRKKQREERSRDKIKIKK